MKRILLFLICVGISVDSTASSELLSKIRGNARENIVPISVFLGACFMICGGYKVNLFSLLKYKLFGDNRSVNEIADDFEEINTPVPGVHLGTIPIPTSTLTNNTGPSLWIPVSRDQL